MKINIKKNIDLYPYLSMRIHSIAEYFLEAKKREELIEAKKFSLENHLPFLILGGGSNVYPVVEKIRGLVVINRYQKLTLLENKDTGAEVLVSSGFPTQLFVKKMIDLGLEGIEYHYGLPGTVGGAIYMNSKWTKPISYFGDYLIKAYLLDDKVEIKEVTRDYFDFRYDYSILQKTKEILLEAVFLFKKNNKNILKKRAEEALLYRKKTQPVGVFTSGCFFKNVNNTSAGYLIDQCGLKGLSVGDFYVSEKHANFIVNRGMGKQEDLLKLIKIIKKKVREKFGFNLEEEVILIKN